MEKKSSIELDMMKNVERVLINVFDDDEEKESSTKPQNQKFNRQYSLETPKIFIGEEYLSDPEKNPPKLFVNQKPISESEKKPLQLFINNEMQPQNNNNEEVNSLNEIPEFFILNEQGEKIEKIISNKNSIDIDDYNKLKGNFLNLITSQNGSRYMQKIYANSDYEILKKIFSEISPYISDCMVDPYANYFCQKFFGVLKKEERKIFLNSIINKIIDISNSKIGTYPLQAVIGQLDINDELPLIMKSIHGKILDLCNNPQGVHVIEKMILCFDESLIQEIYDIIIENFIPLSSNPNGLFVCKKIIYQSKKEENLLRIRDVITKNSMTLIYNQYGNYTIQVAIDSWNRDFSQPLIQSFSSNLITLSCQKYSSNVIEKCIEKSESKLLDEFIDEISKNCNILTLIKNSFGNFVLQKALKLTSGRKKTKLTNAIKKSLEKLSDKKLIKKWKTILQSSLHLTLNLNQDLKNQNNNSFYSSNDHISSSPISERGNTFSNTYFNHKDIYQIKNIHSPGNSPMIRTQLSINNSPFASPMINNQMMSPMRLINSPVHSPMHSPIINSPLGSPIASPILFGRNIMVQGNNNMGMRSNNLMIPQVFMGGINQNVNNNQRKNDFLNYGIRDLNNNKNNGGWK